MGSFDGAEVCKLVGLFIFNDLANKYEQIISDSTGTTDSLFLGNYRAPGRKNMEENNKTLQGTRTEDNNSKQLKIS